MFYVKTKKGYTCISPLGTVVYVQDQKDADSYHTERSAIKDVSWYMVEDFEIELGETL